MLWQGKSGKTELYKDKFDINQRTKYLENSKELANIIKKANDENDFAKYFLDESKISDKEYKPKHNECDMKESDSSRTTEKRICRCMYYYGKSIDKCNKCSLGKKYNNISNKFKVVDYEVPMKYVTKKCGGIDILLEDVTNGEKYAVEVKPKNSTETLVRMIAEINTYMADEVYNYKKAIAFFCGSKQEKDYFNEDYNKNEDFKYILSQVSIFRINETVKDNVIDYEFEILKKEK